MHEFYEKLVISVQPLEAINKLKEINSYVRLNLGKQFGIRADLATLDNDWLVFAKLVDSLRRSTGRNPRNVLKNDQKHRTEGAFQIKEEKQTPRDCVYCFKQGHKATQSDSVKRVEGLKIKKNILKKETLF